MVSEANEPGSESGKRSDDRRGVPGGTPQEGGASTPLAAPGSFAAAAGVLRVDQTRTVDDVVAPMERHGPRAGDRGRGRHQRDDEVKAPRQRMDHRTSAGAAAVPLAFGTSASAASARAIASAASACPAGVQWTSHS